MAADGTYRATLTSTGAVVQGYAVITVEAGGVAAGTAVFQFRDGAGKLTSEAGVEAVLATTRARILVDTAGTQTGVAIASPESPAEVIFELLDRNGNSLETVTRDLESGGHFAAFASELFPSLPSGFLGVVEIRSDVAVVPITLKLTSERSRGLILTTLPIADLTRPTQSDVLVIPQVGWVSGAISLTTRFILINSSTGAVATGSLAFVKSDGGALIPPGELASRIDYQIRASGIGDLQEGQVNLSQIDFNLGDPSLTEIIVNEGNQLILDPTSRDTLGRVRADVQLGFSNLDDQVAEVSPLGLIRGNSSGFSTLTLSGGGIRKKVTITVQRVQSSPGAGFTNVLGVTQDLAGRVYLAVGGEHTIVRFDSLADAPQLYAGTQNTAGIVNAARLTSQQPSPFCCGQFHRGHSEGRCQYRNHRASCREWLQPLHTRFRPLQAGRRSGS